MSLQGSPPADHAVIQILVLPFIVSLDLQAEPCTIFRLRQEPVPNCGAKRRSSEIICLQSGLPARVCGVVLPEYIPQPSLLHRYPPEDQGLPA